MAKSIAELRQSPHVGRTEVTYPICVAGKLVARLQELDRLMLEAQAVHEINTPDGDRIPVEDKRPRRAGSKNPAVQYAKEADKIRDQMLEDTTDVVLRAKELTEWRAWCEANPAREDNLRDLRVGQGVCDVDKLVETLDEYVVTIGGQPPQPGDWDFIRSNAAPADITGVAVAVVGLHEVVVDLGKSRAGWLAKRVNGTDSK